jgi:STE24 endopeptidase
MPLLLLSGGAVMFAAIPLLNAFSRANERRADRFAVRLTGGRDPFVSAMRRLGAQNLAEETPSRLAVWLFHTHPPVDERIVAAREM